MRKIKKPAKSELQLVRLVGLPVAAGAAHPQN